MCANVHLLLLIHGCIEVVTFVISCFVNVFGYCDNKMTYIPGAGVHLTFVDMIKYIRYNKFSASYFFLPCYYSNTYASRTVTCGAGYVGGRQVFYMKAEENV